MSLDRKDVRFKLDPDMHAGLSAIADARGLDMAELVEVWVASEVRSAVHAAIVIAQRTERLGIAGIHRATPGSGK
jgi:hypothetical protein